MNEIVRSLSNTKGERSGKRIKQRTENTRVAHFQTALFAFKNSLQTVHVSWLSQCTPAEEPTVIKVKKNNNYKNGLRLCTLITRFDEI